MNITGLDSIPCFVDTVRKIISKERSWVKTTFYRQYAYDSGIHESFNIEFPDKSADGFALFGLWYQEKPIISICINARPWLSERILDDKEKVVADPSISKPPYGEEFWDKNDVWFELSDEKLQEFVNAETYAEQQAILEKFFEEVMLSIRKYFT